MTIENKLKDLITEKYGSMVKFSQEIEMANSTLATIMKKGIHNANVNNIIKICKALQISADELANDRIVPINEDSPVMNYAKKLSLLSADSQKSAFQYIDYLLSQEGGEP